MAATRSVFWVFPNIAACRAHAGLPNSADVKDVIGHDKVRSGIALGPRKAEGAGQQLVRPRHARVAAGRTGFRRWRRDHRQGLYINQRAVLTPARPALVAVLDDDASAEWIGCAG